VRLRLGLEQKVASAAVWTQHRRVVVSATNHGAHCRMRSWMSRATEVSPWRLPWCYVSWCCSVIATGIQVDFAKFSNQSRCIVDQTKTVRAGAVLPCKVLCRMIHIGLSFACFCSGILWRDKLKAVNLQLTCGHTRKITTVTWQMLNIAIKLRIEGTI